MHLLSRPGQGYNVNLFLTKYLFYTVTAGINALSAWKRIIVTVADPLSLPIFKGDILCKITSILLYIIKDLLKKNQLVLSIIHQI